MLRRIIVIFVGLFLFLFAIIFFMPIFFTITNSFKTMEEMVKPFYAFPERLNLENFQSNIETTHMPRAFLTSFFIVSVSMVGIIFFASLASYAIARRKTAYNQVIYILFVSGLMIPFQVIMIPLMKMVGILQFSNIGGLITIYVALGMSLAIFLLTGFIKSSVPLELEESAYIDGASEFTIFLRIVMPLLSPIIATIIMIDTIWIFNDFLLPSLLLTSKYFTIPLSQYKLAGQYMQKWNLQFAGFTITFIPLFALFLSFQRYFIKGVTEGALKG